MKLRFFTDQVELIPETDMDCFNLGILHERGLSYGMVLIKDDNNPAKLSSLSIKETDFIAYLIR